MQSGAACMGGDSAGGGRAQGVLRVKYSAGWVSLTSASGTPILEECEAGAVRTGFGRVVASETEPNMLANLV